MLNFKKSDSHKYIILGEKYVKAKVTAEIASEAFTTADTDDQAAGSSYFAD
jgi:hypothetical protein